MSTTIFCTSIHFANIIYYLNQLTQIIMKPFALSYGQQLLFDFNAETLNFIAVHNMFVLLLPLYTSTIKNN